MTGDFELVKDFTFEAAHLLPNVADDHKCRQMHGHSYRAEITVCGHANPQTGWVMDFAEIRAAAEPLRVQLDHHVLNDLEGLENPTSEHLARWIFERLETTLPFLSAVTVHETATSRCTYRGASGDH